MAWTVRSSNHGWCKRFSLLSISSRPALGCAQPPVKRVGVAFPGIRCRDVALRVKMGRFVTLLTLFASICMLQDDLYRYHTLRLPLLLQLATGLYRIVKSRIALMATPRLRLCELARQKAAGRMLIAVCTKLGLRHLLRGPKFSRLIVFYKTNVKVLFLQSVYISFVYI